MGCHANASRYMTCFCCGISYQGDIQGTYDAIDKESFTQTDRQVSGRKAASFVNIPSNLFTTEINERLQR